MESIVIPQSVLALVFYALWAVLLVIIVLANRVVLLASRKVRVTEFTPGTAHGSDSYWRINRAHLNAVENLPVFAALVLAGWVAGLDSATFNLLAAVTVGARVVQSLVHISSGAGWAVNLRFSALLVQLVCEVWMGVLIFQAAKLF